MDYSFTIELSRIEEEESWRRVTCERLRTALQESWNKLVSLKTHISSVKASIESATRELDLNRVNYQDSTISSRGPPSRVEVARKNKRELEINLEKLRESMHAKTEALMAFSQTLLAHPMKQSKQSLYGSEQYSAAALLRKELLELYASIEGIEAEYKEACSSLEAEESKELTNASAAATSSLDLTLDEALSGADDFALVRMNGEAASGWKSRLQRRLGALLVLQQLLEAEVSRITEDLRIAKEELTAVELRKQKFQPPSPMYSDSSRETDFNILSSLRSENTVVDAPVVPSLNNQPNAFEPETSSFVPKISSRNGNGKEDPTSQRVVEKTSTPPKTPPRTSLSPSKKLKSPISGRRGSAGAALTLSAKKRAQRGATVKSVVGRLEMLAMQLEKRFVVGSSPTAQTSDRLSESADCRQLLRDAFADAEPAILSQPSTFESEGSTIVFPAHGKDESQHKHAKTLFPSDCTLETENDSNKEVSMSAAALRTKIASLDKKIARAKVTAPPPPMLEVLVLHAKDLPTMRKLDKSTDPYVEATIAHLRPDDDSLAATAGDQESASTGPFNTSLCKRTTTKWKSLNPTWRECLQLAPITGDLWKQELVLSVKHGEEVVGDCAVPLASLRDQCPRTMQLTLEQPPRLLHLVGRMSAHCHVKAVLRLTYSPLRRMLSSRAQLSRQLEEAMRGKENKVPKRSATSNEKGGRIKA